MDDERQAVVEEAKGSLICPWPHLGRYVKRVTIVERCDSGEIIRWSDLNTHLIYRLVILLYMFHSWAKVDTSPGSATPK